MLILFIITYLLAGLTMILAAHIESRYNKGSGCLTWGSIQDILIWPACLILLIFLAYKLRKR